MPRTGYVALCVRPGCEWIALDADGDPSLHSQLGALRAVDEHCRETHGEAARTSRKPWRVLATLGEACGATDCFNGPGAYSQLCAEHRAGTLAVA